MPLRAALGKHHLVIVLDHGDEARGAVRMPIHAIHLALLSPVHEADGPNKAGIARQDALEPGDGRVDDLLFRFPLEFLRTSTPLAE